MANEAVVPFPTAIDCLLVDATSGIPLTTHLSPPAPTPQANVPLPEQLILAATDTTRLYFTPIPPYISSKVHYFDVFLCGWILLLDVFSWLWIFFHTPWMTIKVRVVRHPRQGPCATRPMCLFFVLTRVYWRELGFFLNAPPGCAAVCIDWNYGSRVI